MIRLFKKDIVAALSDATPLFASAFVRKNEVKTPLNELKVCCVGHAVRTTKKFSSIEDFQEFCRDVKYPIYEIGFNHMLKSEHKHSRKFQGKDISSIKYLPEEHRLLVIDFMRDTNSHLSLVSAEFEFLMENMEFDTPATPEIKNSLISFVQGNLPELVKES